ncbi:hypothetical protein GCM10011345_30360 [Gemmobacter megaterium]|uniref:WGR domain-containing protein n=1 Tax=Gemmobacter megaterium TaxID=1086013 RepID=UPI0019A20AA1|nr:WGR domain-containing protein [Gemmobacter megaterium]GGE22403.1 hypothetical protein GCM10011345_30360 [Gemmobacter megaterium]
MLALLFTRPGRFYRVEVTENLFGEYSVLREWGASGCRSRPIVSWFSNLRDAVVAAESWCGRAEKRGFRKIRIA